MMNKRGGGREEVRRTARPPRSFARFGRHSWIQLQRPAKDWNPSPDSPQSRYRRVNAAPLGYLPHRSRKVLVGTSTGPGTLHAIGIEFCTITITNMTEEANITHSQLKQIIPMIETECANFHGQLDDLYQACGLMIAGQLFGWRVMRLIAVRSNWRMATRLFGRHAPQGDIKLLMPEYGPLAHKSVGLKLIEDVAHYWAVIQGAQTIPRADKKAA